MTLLPPATSSTTVDSSYRVQKLAGKHAPLERSVLGGREVRKVHVQGVDEVFALFADWPLRLRLPVLINH